MDVSRLNTFAPDVASALCQASPEAQRRAAEFAAQWAVARAGLAHPALMGGMADDIAGLDERYFALSDDREVGQASTEQVDAAFSRARAASAVEFARRDEPAEAVYEAAAAADDWSELRAGLLSLLGA